MKNYREINKKLDVYFKNVINEFLDENGVNEIRMYKLNNEWNRLDYKDRKLFDDLYFEKNNGWGNWKVNDFRDRFEIWCKRSGMMEKRERGYKNNSKEIWLVR